MVNKNFILALSTIVLGLCGTSAAMVGSSTDSNVVTEKGSQDQSVVPADAVESNPLFQHMKVVCRRMPMEPNIREKIMEFYGIKDAARAFSEFKSHAKEFNYDLGSRYASFDLPEEKKSLFTQLKGIYNKLKSLDLFSVVDSITPEDIKTVLQGINEYDSDIIYGRIEVIRDIRKIAAVILRLINNDAFELNPKARKVLDDYYTPRLADLDEIENEIKKYLETGITENEMREHLRIGTDENKRERKIYYAQIDCLTQPAKDFYSQCMGISEGHFYTKTEDPLYVRASRILELQQNAINNVIETKLTNYPGIILCESLGRDDLIGRHGINWCKNKFDTMQRDLFKLDRIKFDKIEARQPLTDEEDIFLNKWIGIVTGRNYVCVVDHVSYGAQPISICKTISEISNIYLDRIKNKIEARQLLTDEEDIFLNKWTGYGCLDTPYDTINSTYLKVLSPVYEKAREILNILNRRGAEEQ